MSQRNERLMPSEYSSVTQFLIHQAAHRAPSELCSRLEEEWLADLESRTTSLARLRFALGCCWAAMIIVNDCPRVRVAAASPAAPASGVVTLVDRNFGYFSLRSATLFLIAGLHAALFLGLITTLSHTRSPLAPPNLQNHDVTPLPPDRLPFALTASELKHWTIYLPRLPLDPPSRLTIEKDAIGGVSDKPTDVGSLPVAAATPTHVVQQVAGGPGVGFPETADFYPSQSVRLGEEGMTTVRVCVDKRGRLTSEATITSGSGSARLDQAAIKLARAGAGHYRATTEDGQPVDSCYPFGVRFQLRK